MTNNAKKLAVLQRLKQEEEPVSLKELLVKLGDDYFERSVRRWLSEMAKEGLVERKGNKRATKYQATRQLSYLGSNVARCFCPESEKTIEQVRRPLYEREPLAYSDHWFNAYQPNRSAYIPLELRRQLHSAGKRSKIEDPAGTYAHQIFNLQDIHPLLDLYVFSYMRTCVMYDSTVKAIGFDEIRVHYREKRRAIIREIILNLLIGKEMQAYILSQSTKLVKREDHEAFIEDIMEDLHEIGPSRIAGLGITLEQLQKWIAIQKT